MNWRCGWGSRAERLPSKLEALSLNPVPQKEGRKRGREKGGKTDLKSSSYFKHGGWFFKQTDRKAQIKAIKSIPCVQKSTESLNSPWHWTQKPNLKALAFICWSLLVESTLLMCFARTLAMDYLLESFPCFLLVVTRIWSTTSSRTFASRSPRVEIWPCHLQIMWAGASLNFKFSL
jgi:hypothetical protein